LRHLYTFTLYFVYSIFGSVIWPCIPILVKPNLQGTAYGIMTSFQNAGQFIVPLVLSQVYKASHSYVPCEGFFIVSSLIGSVVSVMIWVLDERINHGTLRMVDDSLAGSELLDHSEVDNYRKSQGLLSDKNGMTYTYN